MVFAGLDVFEQEPLPLAHPLRSLDNALLTSHYGFICKEVLQTFATNVQAHLEEWLGRVHTKLTPSDGGRDQTTGAGFQ